MYDNWSVAQLQSELRVRKAPITGKKAALIERLLAYDKNNNFVLNVDVRPELPPFSIPSDDLFRDVNSNTNIPPLTQKHVELFLLRHNKKLGQALEMYKNNFLNWVRYCDDGPNEHFLKALCDAEYKKKVKYIVNVKLADDGSIEGSICDCAAGAGGEAHCKHIIVLLLASEQISREGICFTKKTCTQKLQTFHHPKKDYTGTPIKANAIKKKENQSNQFDPRPVKFRNTGKVNERVKNLCVAFKNSSMPCKQILTPANPYAIDLDHDYSKLGRKQEFLEAINIAHVSEDDVQKIELLTRGQASNKLWHEHRQYRITASKFFDVSRAMRILRTKGSEDSCKKLAHNILNPTKFSAKATEHGIINESIAVKEYMARFDGALEEVECGLFISHTHPFLGASPDRLLAKVTVMEVKCPYAARNRIITPVTVPYLYFNEDGILSLKKSHNYYYQVQGQLFVTGREFCDFIVYTYQDMKVVSIARDTPFITAEMLNDLTEFYRSYFLPALLEKFYYRYYCSIFP